MRCAEPVTSPRRATKPRSVSRHSSRKSRAPSASCSRRDVAGWKQTKIEQENALGFTNVTATYTKAETTATVSLTGTGSGGGGLGGLLGGFARAGLASTGQAVRVAGLPATVQTDGTIAVTLEDGSFLTFSSSKFNTQETALAGLGDLVNAFPVAAINKALQ